MCVHVCRMGKICKGKAYFYYFFYFYYHKIAESRQEFYYREIKKAVFLQRRQTRELSDLANLHLVFVVLLHQSDKFTECFNKPGLVTSEEIEGKKSDVFYSV